MVPADSALVLHTPRLLLRRLTEADAPALHTAFGDPEAMRYWDAPPARDLAETTSRVRGSRAIGTDFHAGFAVVRCADGLVVGMVNYHARNAEARRLAVGWITVRRFWRQGVMREAVPALLDHCFTTLETHRIEARIEPANVPSIRLAESLGFACEGLMRDWMVVGGEPRSACLYALLRPEWRALRRA